MKGQFFAHIVPDPKQDGRINVRIGTVKSEVGPGSWLLEFVSGSGYRFSNVFSAEQLQQFAFFNSAPERTAFLKDIMGPTPSPMATPPGESIEALPQPDSVVQ